jgi:hypothetical protein
MANDSLRNIKAGRLISELAARGLLDQAGQEKIRSFLDGRGREQELPLFLRLLLALGAYIASAFFVAFLAVAHIINFHDGKGLLVWGVIFIAAALALHHVPARNGPSVGRDWIIQTSFSAMLVGKALFVFGVIDWFFGRHVPSEHVAAIVAGVVGLVTVVIYPFYDMTVDRFLSVLATLGWALLAIIEEDFRAGGFGAPLTVWFVVQLALAGALLTSGRLKHAHLPAAYAVVCSLCAIVLFWGDSANITRGFVWRISQDGRLYAPDPLWGSLALTAALVALIAWAAGGAQKLRSEPLALASLGAAALGALSAPGILLSIGLMTLGYARRDRLLAVAGIALTPVFIVMFYYSLNLNFLWKSAVLIASGGVLLGGRALMRWRGWDAEA